MSEQGGDELPAHVPSLFVSVSVSHLRCEQGEIQAIEHMFANACSGWYNECMKLLLRDNPLYRENA